MLIIPGFSLKNKPWAEEVQKHLSSMFAVSVHYWPFWEMGQAEEGWIEKEKEKIINETVSPVNVIAKSIGTLVAMKILNSKPELVKKIILCGIPVNDFHQGDDEFYKGLKSLKEENILCIQNENDNHGSFSGVEKFVHSINPKIKVVSTPRFDHEYPYFAEFSDFFK